MSAREWLTRGVAALSPIDAFTDYWRGFNNLYGSIPGNELSKIRSFLTANVPPAAATTMLTAHPVQVAYLLSQPVIDMRGTGRDAADAIAAFHASTDPLAKLCEVFAVIYQVRCNLQHGQKSPTVDRDVRLCECSAPLTAAVVARSV